MDNNIVFEQFTMFNIKPITNNIILWGNALSYSNELSNFIEIVDKEEQSYSRIPKWENESKVIDIENLKQSTGLDILDKRTLYIFNSFTMAFEMCFERYCHQTQKNQNDYYINLNNIAIQKGSKPSNIATDSYDKDNSAFYIIAYVNDTYDGGELYFLENNFLIKPGAGSVLIVPAEYLDKYITKDIFGTRYIASTIVYKRMVNVESEQ